MKYRVTVAVDLEIHPLDREEHTFSDLMYALREGLRMNHNNIAQRVSALRLHECRLIDPTATVELHKGRSFDPATTEDKEREARENENPRPR